VGNDDGDGVDDSHVNYGDNDHNDVVTKMVMMIVMLWMKMVMMIIMIVSMMMIIDYDDDKDGNDDHNDDMMLMMIIDTYILLSTKVTYSFRNKIMKKSNHYSLSLTFIIDN
jgi:heme/copper-type cytochrome/quinol oxidase subunit 3